MWSLVDVASEASSNLAARKWRSGLLLIPLMLIFAFQAHLESVTLNNAINDELENLRDGSRVLVVGSRTPNAEPLLYGPRCDRLGSLPHARAAAGLTIATSLEVTSAPGTPLLHVRGTAAAPEVLDPTLSPFAPGYHYISWDAAEAQGVVVPGTINAARPGTAETTNGPVAGFDPAHRLSAGAISLLTVEPLTTVSECWLELQPGAEREAAANVALAALNTETTTFAVRSVLEVDPSPAEVYQSRVTRQLWMLVAGFVSLLGSLVALADRRESALYRTLGAGRLGAVAIGGLESLIVNWWAAALGAGAWYLGAPDLAPEATSRAIWSVVAAVNIGVAASLLARLALTSGSIVDQLKDRG